MQFRKQNDRHFASKKSTGMVTLLKNKAFVKLYLHFIKATGFD